MTEAGSRKWEAGSAQPRANVLKRITAVVRRIIGAPDYPAYLEHVAGHHPGCTPLTEAEFIDQQLTARYSAPGSRCC